ncbi:MAG: ribulose-5-phosphate 4-epimerase/fuculose-1-phosphate aldolase [Verrucomicrobiales bacterium]|jgi:ribulose-5-phosphate 4-epimerase/fuculose-1-phosphate aldolase
MSTELEIERMKRKREVALGYRIFASLRWGDLGDGHITARDPEFTDHMWLLRYSCGFERATVDELVLVRPDGTTADGTEINLTAYNIHHPIHEARPDVVGAAHIHTPWGTPFSATGRPIEPVTQEACTFHDRWAFFDDEEVQILNRNGGERIAEALGDKQVAILRSHGLITTGSSVAETIAAFVTLERVTEALMKTSGCSPISDTAAKIARDDLVKGRSLELAFQFLVSRHVGDPSVVG